MFLETYSIVNNNKKGKKRKKETNPLIWEDNITVTKVF